MTRASLELGGKSPVIVLDDADPIAVIGGAASAISSTRARSAPRGSRLLRAEEALRQGRGRHRRQRRKMKLGSGLDPTTQIAPLVSNGIAIAFGATSRPARRKVPARWPALLGLKPGYFVRPTAFVDAENSMRIVREEIFGPVLVAMPFDDLDEIARKANTRSRLGASIWSRDLSKVHRLIPRSRPAPALGQLPQLDRPGASVWRLQAIRPGPGRWAAPCWTSTRRTSPCAWRSDRRRRARRCADHRRTRPLGRHSPGR